MPISLSIPVFLGPETAQWLPLRCHSRRGSGLFTFTFPSLDQAPGFLPALLTLHSSLQLLLFSLSDSKDSPASSKQTKKRENNKIKDQDFIVIDYKT